MRPKLRQLSIILLFYFICCSIQVMGEHQSNKIQSSLGPFEIYNADSTSSIRLQFAGQLRLAFNSQDNGSNNSRTNELLMSARRIRLTLKGTIYNPDLSYKLHLSTAPKSLELMDLYFDYKLNTNFQFRFGQYKSPFTRYRIQSFQRLAFVDWALVTKYFGAERQMGLALHNGYENPPNWGYVFGIYTGVNARASHAIGLSKVYGENAVNPSDLADGRATANYHPEFFLHLTYNANNIQATSNSVKEQSRLRYSLGISSAWNIDPTPFHNFAFRLAPEFVMKHNRLSFATIGYAGYSEISGNSKIMLTMTGALFQTAYSFTDNHEISLRYSFVKFNDELTNDAMARALRLIDDSGNELDIIEQYKNAGRISREQELTLGFNVYIIGHSMKWQNDFSWLRHTYIDKVSDDFLARSQFQVTF